MKYEGEKSFTGTTGLSYSPLAVTKGFVKIFATGELNTQAAEHRSLQIFVNEIPGGYQGFTLMNGHAVMGEWDNSGFYVGRNGWSQDATFMLEYTLAISPTSQKITGAGQATFAHGNDTMLGFESHGFVVTGRPIESVQIRFTGGVATGISRFYTIS